MVLRLELLSGRNARGRRQGLCSLAGSNAERDDPITELVVLSIVEHALAAVGGNRSRGACAAGTDAPALAMGATAAAARATR